MKYVPRPLGDAAEASSGGGGKAQAVEFLKLAVFMVALLMFIWLILGASSERLALLITPEQETALFSADFFDLEEPPAEGPYAAQTAFLQKTLGEFVARRPDLPELPYQLYLMDGPPNAFAIPGGKIAFSTGLLDALDDEVALAFVLGHELGHFYRRDHLRRLGRQLGAQVGVVLVFGGGDAMGGRALDMLNLAYSREAEALADRFGLSLVVEMFGHAQGAEGLFETLLQEEKMPGWAYMFTTHPDTEGRIEKLRGYAEELAQKGEP
ncbi:MAG: M48 family metallopeptidase [Verrucomicrobiales bacterium]